MRVLMISLDRKVFEKDSPAQMRMLQFGSIFEELHIIVYAEKKLGLASKKIAENIWLYPTNASSRYLHPLKALQVAKREIARGGTLPVDAVSAQDAAETGLAAWRIAKKYHLPLHLQDHADVFDPEYARESMSNKIRVVLARFLLPRARAIRVVSESSKNILLAHLPYLSGKITVLPVYIELSQYLATTGTFSLREKCPQFHPLMFVACRLVPQKDIPLALEVLKKLLPQNPNAGLVIVGEGNDRESIISEAAMLGLQDRLIVEPWQNDLAAYYKSADVFLMTSHYESYGRTLVEAAASGLPFVSTDVGVADALVARGVAGAVSKDRDPAHFADLITRVLQQSLNRVEIQSKNVQVLRELQGGSYEEYLSRYSAMMRRCLV